MQQDCTRYGVISDLHLEFRDDFFADALADKFNSADCDTLILAGDIHADPIKRDEFFMKLEKPYIFVMGNHDYYGEDEFYEFDYLDDKVYGCTLWTNFNNDYATEIRAKHNISDFSYIKGFSVDVCKSQFMVDKFRIFEHRRPITVTHFAPSWLSIAPKYAGDILNQYFVNDLENQILDSGIKVWIHGHTHSPFDYMIGDCRVICNPLGYPNENKSIGEKNPWDLVFFEL